MSDTYQGVIVIGIVIIFIGGMCYLIDRNLYYGVSAVGVVISVIGFVAEALAIRASMRKWRS